ncbi:MAG: thioredoxin family protein [Acidobacteriota bacterium]
MYRKRILVGILLAIGFVLTAQSSVFAADFSIGQKLDGFTLPDTDGKSRTYEELKGKNGAVVVFLSAQCPVVRGYKERINQIAADYESKGIRFIGINSNSSEGLDWVKSNAAENYKFPVLIDKGNVLADRLGANATPEVFYFDAAGALAYHGAIDDDRTGRNIKTSYLRAAFDSTLVGKKVETTEVKAFGCSIRRVGDN